MATSRLEILLQAKNQSAREFNQVNAQLRGLDSAADTASKGIGGLGAALGAAGMVAFGQQVIGVTAALSDEAAQLRRAETAALSLAGSQRTLNELMQTYQRVSGGAVTEGEALAEVARLQAIGFADNAQELERFITAARGSALAGGKAVGDIIGELSLTIANQSRMRLDQLGLSVTEVEARIDELRKTNSNLSSEAAFQEAVLGTLVDKYGDIATGSAGAATGVEQLRRELRQAREEIAEDSAGPIDRVAGFLAGQVAAIGEANARSMETSLRGQADALTEVISRQQEELDEVNKQIAAYEELNGAGGKWNSSLRQLTAQQADLTASIATNKAEAYALAASMGDLTGANERARFETGEVELAAYAAGGALSDMGTEADTTAGKLANFSLEALAAKQSMDTFLEGRDRAFAAINKQASDLVDKLGPQGAVRWTKEQTVALNEQWQVWRDMGFDEAQIVNVLQPAYLDNLSDGVRKLTTTKTAVAQVSEEFRSLEGAVNRALSGALDPGVGVDPDKVLEGMGLAPDRINEQARRLADIAKNGLTGQDWLGDFAANAPDVWGAIRMASNPQEEAAYMLRDFQAGLRPDLIDRGVAKDMARRLLLGEMKMADLAQELSSELAAEMGISREKALGALNQAVGLGGMSGPGMDGMESFTAGAESAISANDLGGRVLDAFTSSMANRYDRLATAGEEAAKQYGQAFGDYFSEHVPARLVNVLATLITPQVMAELYQHGTLTGATE